MTDQNSQFFAILTAVGEAKQANANALGVPWTFAQMGVGDANNTDPVPSRTQTKLINERRRAPLNQLSVDPKDASIIIAEQVIPPDVGGWWIREIGLYDAAGDLVAVANCAPSYKPLLAQGTGKTQVVRLNLVVTSTANVQLKIDPAVVLATREYVDAAIVSVLPKNKVAGAYTKVIVDERGVVQQGSNPTTIAGIGVQDVYTKASVDYLLTLKSNALDVYSKALVDSALSLKSNVLDVYSKAAVDSSLSLKANSANTLAGYGITDAFTKNEVYSALNAKSNKATTLAGYGISDAIPNLNPLPGGSYDLHGTNYAFVSSPLESSACQNIYWDGQNWQKHNATVPAATLSVTGGHVYVRTWPAGSTGGQNYNVSEVVDRSMEATVPDLDAGTTPAKWVSVAGLAYYVASKAKAATEAVVGMCRFATYAEVVSGASGHIAVPPAYLVGGFSSSFTPDVGYIKLPQWLGGFMIQWSYSEESGSYTDYRHFPVPFNSVFGAWLQLSYQTVNGFGGSYGTIVQVVDVTKYLWSAGGTFGGGGKGWILALGR